MHATPRHTRGTRRLPKPRTRWAFPALAVVLTAALAAYLLWPHPAACADPRPNLEKSRPGVALHHPDWTLVACSYPNLPPDGLYASLSVSEYANAALCGASLEITGPKGTVRTLVVDRCPACNQGHLDLSDKAFAQIANPTQGKTKITYKLTRNPHPPPKPTIRIKQGSSTDWLALLIQNHGNPIAAVHLRQQRGPWRLLKRGADNHWTLTNPGRPPYEARLTDTQGHYLTIKLSTLTPARRQALTPLYASRAAALPLTPGSGPPGHSPCLGQTLPTP